MTTFSERLYRLLLALYPADFRREYGSQMAQMFREQCRTAHNQGVIALTALWLRTLQDAAVTIVIEHLEARKRGSIMLDLSENADQPGSWITALLGAVPFIVYGVVTLCFSLDQNGMLTAPGPLGWAYIIWAVFIANAVTTVLLGLGWLKGFPRWSYAGLLPLLYFTDWLAGVWSYGKPSPMAGIKAWLPLLAMLVIVLALTRSLRPLWQFLKGAWDDWTRLSFLLYGSLLVMQSAMIDETHGMLLIAYVTVSVILLSVGAAAYLRSQITAHRVLSLLVGIVAGMLPIFLFTSAYWNGRYESWMAEPQPVLQNYELALKMAGALAVWSVILLSPALLALLKHAGKRTMA